jgi:hypothetical protein
VDDLVAEKGDEASSSQALSEENQAKLKEIFSLLQRNVQDQVRDVDLPAAKECSRPSQGC